MAYGVYVGNYKNSQDTVLRLKAEKNGKLVGFLQEVANKYPNDPKDFMTLLSEPVKHITNLESLLEQISHSAQGLPDEQQINDAYSMIHETNTFVKENLLKSQGTAGLFFLFLPSLLPFIFLLLLVLLSSFFFSFSFLYGVIWMVFSSAPFYIMA